MKQQDNTTDNIGINRHPITKQSKYDFDFMLSEKEVAELLKVSCSWLQHQRLKGNSIPYIKCGRAIRYSLSAVKDYIAENTRTSTSDNNGGNNA